MISKLRMTISDWARAQAAAHALGIKAYPNRREPGARLYLDNPEPEDLEALAAVMREMRTAPTPRGSGGRS